MRHGTGLLDAGAFDAGAPHESLPAVIVGTLGTRPDCGSPATTSASVGTVTDRTEPGAPERNTALPLGVADHTKLNCVLPTAIEDNSPDLSGMHVSGGVASPTSPPAGIDASLQQTCDCCGGSGRHAHLTHLVCGVCRGSGLMPALAFELAVFALSNATLVLLS